MSVCNDGNPCADDSADEGNACACSYAPTAQGTEYSDGNACTLSDACDGANACAGNGSYGSQGVNGAPGAPRVSTTCP